LLFLIIHTPNHVSRVVRPYAKPFFNGLTSPREIHKIRFLGDPTGKFTGALDLLFDGTAIFGNARAKRYVLVVEDGTVKEAYVEPDNTGVDGRYFRVSHHLQAVTTAKNVLG
jgi:peroxiredoxin